MKNGNGSHIRAPQLEHSKNFPYSRRQLNSHEQQHRELLIKHGVDPAIAIKIAKETIAPEIKQLNAMSAKSST